jgi:ActR/RegA family two-component response regulator
LFLVRRERSLPRSRGRVDVTTTTPLETGGDGAIILVGLPSALSAELAREARALGRPVVEVGGDGEWLPATGNGTDILISLLEPPEDNGLKQIRLLRGKYAGARLVAISSTSSLTKVAEAVRLGASTVVARPTTVSQILAALGHSPPTNDVPHSHMSLDRAIWEFLNQSVQEAGSISGAARRLNLDRTSLKRMLRKVPAIDVAPVALRRIRARRGSF